MTNLLAMEQIGLVPQEPEKEEIISEQLLREFVAKHYAQLIESIISWADSPEMLQFVVPKIDEIIPEANARIQRLSLERLRMLRGIILQIDTYVVRLEEVGIIEAEYIEDQSCDEEDGISSTMSLIIKEKVDIAESISRLWAVYESILPPLPRLRKNPFYGTLRL